MPAYRPMAGLNREMQTMAMRPSPYGVLQSGGTPPLPSLAALMPTPSAGLPTNPVSAAPLTPYVPGEGLGSFSPPTPTPPAAGGGGGGSGLPQGPWMWGGRMINTPATPALKNKLDFYYAHNTDNTVPPPDWYSRLRGYGYGGFRGHESSGGSGLSGGSGGIGGRGGQAGQNSGAGGVGPGTGGVY